LIVVFQIFPVAAIRCREITADVILELLLLPPRPATAAAASSSSPACCCCFLARLLLLLHCRNIVRTISHELAQ
jgi:hypothetical protein